MLECISAIGQAAGPGFSPHAHAVTETLTCLLEKEDQREKVPSALRAYNMGYVGIVSLVPGFWDKPIMACAVAFSLGVSGDYHSPGPALQGRPS